MFDLLSQRLRIALDGKGILSTEAMQRRNEYREAKMAKAVKAAGSSAAPPPYEEPDWARHIASDFPLADFPPTFGQQEYTPGPIDNQEDHLSVLKSPGDEAEKYTTYVPSNHRAYAVTLRVALQRGILLGSLNSARWYRQHDETFPKHLDYGRFKFAGVYYYNSEELAAWQTKRGMLWESLAHRRRREIIEARKALDEPEKATETS